MRWLPDPVERVNDAEDTRGIIEHPLDSRELLAGAGESQQPSRRKTTPGQSRFLDPRGREVVRIVAEAGLPPRQ